MTTFWRAELEDLKSKLRLLARVLFLVVAPVAGLLWIGLPERVAIVLVVVGTAALGLTWAAARLRTLDEQRATRNLGPR